MKKIEILFEDEHICVINKPAGILSVPNHAKDKSALGILEEIMRQKGTYSPKHKPLAVHRLDRDTSGVMMFALSESAQTKLMNSWHATVTERLYRAVAENPKNPRAFLPKSGLIDDNLAFNAYNVGFVPKSEHHSAPSRHSEFISESKTFQTVPARTNFKTILRGKTHTLFELSLDTGKKNQIRAHLASKGYPLAGDKNYRAKTNAFGRLCLHARTLEFVHPFTNQKMRFEVPEPKEWKEYVEKGDSRSKNQNQNREKQNFGKNKVILGEKRLTRKEKAHMDFIERGKSGRF